MILKGYEAGVSPDIEKMVETVGIAPFITKQRHDSFVGSSYLL